MTGRSYHVTGGFWSLISVVQTAGLPCLTIAKSGNRIIISWPNTGSCTLQQNNNLSVLAGWTTTGYPVTTLNGTNSVTITQSAGNCYFRLMK